MNNNETVQSDPGSYAAKRARPFPKRRKGKKGGRLFFPALIFFSGILVLFLSVCSIYQKEVGIVIFEQMVIDRNFTPLLSERYGKDEAEGIRKKLSHFYGLAQDGTVGDQVLSQVNAHLQKIIGDQHLEKEEVQSLLSLISSYDKKAQHQNYGENL